MGGKTAYGMAWIDLEATGLLPKPQGEIVDYSSIHIMEFAIVLTDLDFEPLVGYDMPVKMTSEIATALRATPDALSMHKATGLTKDCVESTMTLADIEAEVVKLFEEQTTFDPGDFAIAGSGVAHYDSRLLEVKMPLVNRWLSYFPADIGVMRRMSKWMNHNQDVVNVEQSWQEGQKAHRAMGDVMAHLKEAQEFRDFIRRAVALGAIQ